MNACDRCGSSTTKVIYLGLPGRICDDDACSFVNGLAGHAAWYVPVVSYADDGTPGWSFMGYEGSYLKALWTWLTGGPGG